MRSNEKAIPALQDVSSSGGLEIAVASNPFTVKASVQDRTAHVVLAEEAADVFLSNGKSKLAASGSYRGHARVKVNGRVLHAPSTAVSVDVPLDYVIVITGVSVDAVAAQLQEAYQRTNRRPLPEGVPIQKMVVTALQKATAAYGL